MQLWEKWVCIILKSYSSFTMFHSDSPFYMYRETSILFNSVRKVRNIFTTAWKLLLEASFSSDDQNLSNLLGIYVSSTIELAIISGFTLGMWDTISLTNLGMFTLFSSDDQNLSNLLGICVSLLIHIKMMHYSVSSYHAFAYFRRHFHVGVKYKMNTFQFLR